MRYQTFFDNKFYYGSGLGAASQEIFRDDEDKVRFIFLITHMQSPTRLYNISWYGERYLKKGSFMPSDRVQSEIISSRTIELLCFAVVGNKFEIILKNLEEAMLSVFMQRVLTSYSKYFNSKYGLRGHVFSGPFKANILGNMDELLAQSARTHLLPFSYSENQEDYKWSSYMDYIGSNRWQSLLCTDHIMNKFKNQTDYKQFVNKHKSN